MKKKDEIIAEMTDTEEVSVAHEKEGSVLTDATVEALDTEESVIMNNAEKELKKTAEASDADTKIFSFDTLRTSLILLLVTGFTVLLLAFVNYFTEGPIAAHRKAELDRSVAAMFPDSQYTQITDMTLPEGVGELYLIHTDANEPRGFLIIAKPTGFGGEMELMVGTDLDGNVGGVKIISDSETATKVAPIKAEGFLDSQYVSKKAPFDFVSNGGTVDVVAGSTVSSEAVLNGVNDACGAVNAYLDLLRKEQAE